MSKFFKSILALVASFGLVIGVTGCASEPVDMSKVSALIDVRTASEFAAGHLQGAVNIDVESSDFNEKVGTLDKAGKYLVYCHSGRRAGIAVDDMKALGFTDVKSIGGINDAASVTKLDVVQ
jgi:phage shock protein E